MPRRLLYPLLLCLFLADLGYTAWQFHRQPLDGDMAWNLLPDPEVAPILEDPLGLGPLLYGETYANPNRFFCHWTYRGYLLNTPRLLGRFTDPVSSVYLACTLAKLLIHLGLLLVLVRGITGKWRPQLKSSAIILCVLFPLFQTEGYRGQLGIVDPSTTYAFFYALPAIALLFFLLPFTDRLLHQRTAELNPWQLLLLTALSFVVTLSGPLNPGVILVLTVLGGIGWWRGQRWPTAYVAGWGLVAGLSAYSLYLGRFNSLSIASEVPLWELYGRLPAGLFGLLTTKLGWPLLLAGLLVNYFLLEKGPVRRAYPWLLAFAVLYCGLLPLGGYRAYRPELLRYDTLLPATLGAVALYGAGTVRLLLQNKHRWYPLLPVVLGLVFTLADGPVRDTNDCEWEEIYHIATTLRDGPVAVDCPVLFWKPQHDPTVSRANAELLVRWGIGTEVRLYYQPQ